MTILAVYYAFADTVLLSQCFYYRGFRFSDAPTKSTQAVDEENEATEESPLIYCEDSSAPQRRKSISSTHSHKHNYVDPTHLSPATPLLDLPETSTVPPQPSTLKSILFNATALALVIAAGIFGWWISRQSSHSRPHQHHHNNHNRNNHHQEIKGSPIIFDLPGQIFGYLCATLYLGSRIPQLLLNYRRKSTEGVSMLFFLFACVGNLTYVLSILAYEPLCAKALSTGLAEPGAASGVGKALAEGSRGCEDGQWRTEYRRYISVNASWLVGSAGTLLLDLVIFGQFWVYRDRAPIASTPT